MTKLWALSAAGLLALAGVGVAVAADGPDDPVLSEPVPVTEPAPVPEPAPTTVAPAPEPEPAPAPGPAPLEQRVTNLEGRVDRIEAQPPVAAKPPMTSPPTTVWTLPVRRPHLVDGTPVPLYLVIDGNHYDYPRICTVLGIPAGTLLVLVDPDARLAC